MFFRLQELQKRQSIKSEGIGSSATLPYKKKTSQPNIGSTAALVAMAAKKRTSKESLVSFNERAESQAKPKPKAMVIHEKSGSNSKEVSAPEWIKMAQKINERVNIDLAYVFIRVLTCFVVLRRE